MRRSAIVLGLAWLSVVRLGGQAATWIVADDGQHANGQMLLSSARVACDGTLWALPTYVVPASITIENVFIWIGTDAAPPGQPYPQVDALAAVYTSRPAGYRLAYLGLDRYAAPSGPHAKDTPRKHRLFTGDQIGGNFSCTALFGATSHAQVSIGVEYVKQ